MSTHIRLALALIVAMIGVAGPCLAQDRPVAFVHGLASGGDTWGPAAARLQAALAIQPHAPTVDSRTQFPWQAAQLEGAIGGLPGQTIAVGHSNGGIVAREWSRLRPLGGIVTLGTPNRGAPLLYNILAWSDFNYYFSNALGWLFNSALDCFHRSCGWEWVLFANGLGTAVDTMWSLHNESLLSLATTVGIDVTMPVFGQMLPTSSYLQGLNAQANRDREAAEVPARVGIYSVAHNFYDAGSFRAIWPDAADEIDLYKDSTIAVLDYLSSYIYVSQDANSFAYDIADAMSAVADWLFELDPFWCEVVSWPGLGQCWANDTILPDWSQVYPDPRAIPIFAGDGPVHIRETTESDFWLHRALTEFLNVPARADTPSLVPPADPGSPPPPPDPIGTLPPDAGASPPPPPPPPPSGPASPPPPPGRFKWNSSGVCAWDPNDYPPDQCTPAPPPGRYKFDGTGNCYWEPNDYPPDQCAPAPTVQPPAGRFKLGPGGCYWDPNDAGPNQCAP